MKSREVGGEREEDQRLRELARAARVLEPQRGKRKALRRSVVRSTERFLGGLAELDSYISPTERALGLLETPIGEEGIAIDEAVALLERDVIATGANTASGGHMAYIPGSSLYLSALGDFFAAITNKYAGIFFSAPGAVRMENMLVRWTADLVGYPEEAGGHLASGGSIANLSAICTARDAHSLKGADYSRACVYLTSQAHHCIDKALRIAGLGEARLRYVPLDDRFRMRPDALAEMIAQDQRLGFRPWLVIATAGTTDTGAVDPLEAIADVAHGAGCWYHVDAAYGGYFLLTEQGRTAMRGIERSDSAVLDPHKSLFIPYGTGVVIVRDRAKLAAAHAYHASYMQDAVRDATEVSPADLSPELTKHFRALRMWLPLIVHGTTPFVAALEEKLLLARYFRRKVAELGFAVGPETDLSIVTYRWEPEGTSLEESNAINRRILEGVLQDGRVFLSSTMIDGRYTLRMVALSFRTHRKQIDRALSVLRDQIERVAHTG